MNETPHRLLELFQSIVPEEGWQELDNRKRPAQIYTLPVVVGLMLAQRLNERGTQQQAVHELEGGRLSDLLPDGKRVREGKISLATGGYSRACGKIATEVVEQISDELLAELGRVVESKRPTGDDSESAVLGGRKRRIMLLDGSSLRVEHVKGLLAAYPPGHNQHGAGHWGVVKWVGLHDVDTGIAERPAWGPMYGPEAASEQELAEQVLERAPASSVILGDANFGIFCFVYAVHQSKHPMIFRLSKPRAQALAPQLRPGQELTVTWEPSAYERREHVGLPADAQVQGRLIAVLGKGFRDPLYLFTTMTEAVEQVVAHYAKRWNLELDIRTLKGTLRVEHLRGKSREAVEKELLIAVVAYGMVRAFMALAAWQAGLSPRRLSFTRAYGLLNVVSEQLCSTDEARAERAYDRLMVNLGKSKLPVRTKVRKYPREVWGSGKYYPTRRSQPSETK